MRAWTASILLIGLGLAQAAQGQAVPPIYGRGGVIAFVPQVDFALSGAAMNVTPVVSADRKYVTLGMSPQVSQIVRIEPFPVVEYGTSGLVGFVRPAALARGNADSMNASAPLFVRDGRAGASLNLTGVTRLASLD
jgi:hypothetical protein